MFGVKQLDVDTFEVTFRGEAFDRFEFVATERHEEHWDTLLRAIEIGLIVLGKQIIHKGNKDDMER